MTSNGAAKGVTGQDIQPASVLPGDIGENDSRIKLYRTSDIYFAAYLCTVGFHMEATEEEKNSGGKKVVFVFRMRDVHVMRARSEFFGGNGTVRAGQFVNNIKNLKSLCFT